MKITNHGQWAHYEPDPHPLPDLKQRVMFCRRESDQRDWYDFQKELRNDNIKMTIQISTVGWLVQATARDPSMLFPGGMMLLEVDDTQSEHEAYRQKQFDPERQTFFERQLPIDKTSFLLTLHDMGLLSAWKEYLSKADDVTCIMFESNRLLALDDRHVREAAGKLGWDLQKIFDNAGSKR